MAEGDVVIDLTGYKDRVGSRVLPGRYRVVVEDVEQDTSKAGNPMINVWLLIQGGEFDGATITDRLTLTEKSLFRVVGFMQAIGLPTPRKRLKINIRQFVGKVLDVDVDDGDPYQGRVKSEVRGYVKVAKAAQAEVEDLPGEDDMSAFDGSAEAQTAETPAEPAEAAEQPPTKAQATSNGAATSTDIPDPEDVDLDSLDLG